MVQMMTMLRQRYENGYYDDTLMMIKEIRDLKQAECVDTLCHHGHSKPHIDTSPWSLYFVKL